MNGYLLLATYLTVLFPLGWLLAKPIAYLIDTKKTTPTECFILKWLRISDEGMNWKQYALAIFTFNILGFIVLFAILSTQGYLPLNPQHLSGLSWDLAFNTAISFVTNTNWQAYGGGTTMSYFSQMAGLTVQNFLSASTGIAVAFAFIRGLTRSHGKDLGNAWMDLLRITIYILVPISFVLAILMVGQGVPDNFMSYVGYTSLQGHSGIIPMGPIASQEAIKMLGTNGGGFFNANSAHPFENPTYLSNFMQMLAIFIIPTALCFAFGRVAKDKRQGTVLIAAMTVIFIAAVVWVMKAESQTLLINGHAMVGNMEGKETRFGIDVSSLFSVITTAASCGAVSSMLDSFTALGGLIPMWLIQLGEVIFGGVGAGFYGIMMFVFLTVFIAGLMIGRTPEYLGKKVESFEMKMTALAILCAPLLVLIGTAITVTYGTGSIQESGPHGFSEALYALSSAANNNGSAFAGFSANTVLMNLLTGFSMFVGRFGVIFPVLAIAGSLIVKPCQAETSGTLSTNGIQFIGLLVGTVLLIGALTFIPALALGPVAEHLIMAKF
ncbi:potassium-transporting ATPase subunit KdpA [Photobacterium kishitanii]|uniref:potassium-transporting ATPase subunit KdpA n=1 Tax=Photobacterium kishitanii TaxID=318456 RepID=UPI0005D43C21|nr:potassium-transporting ATPase subunit KdpA [Photobacterium kishitanii]KJG09478.1 potassium-transporting ATPase subunit A [Photobacterium kishitanii]PSV07824.1 potassium-transporting ATPase subunit KdpA [Photobacterium kishitanii]PSV76312.1 potassium-transporting ATPase subunit KdpA [Photobacterium kishitanii]